MKFKPLITALFLLASSPDLLADEVWNSTYGQVVYAQEVGKTAVWTYTMQGTKGMIYINDLAGVYQGRGAYKGYWVQASSGVKCKSSKLMEGVASFYWGRFEIKFVDPDFPSRWQAKWSYCEKPAKNLWQGIPATN